MSQALSLAVSKFHSWNYHPDLWGRLDHHLVLQKRKCDTGPTSQAKELKGAGFSPRTRHTVTAHEWDVKPWSPSGARKSFPTTPHSPLGKALKWIEFSKNSLTKKWEKTDLVEQKQHCSENGPPGEWRNSLLPLSDSNVDCVPAAGQELSGSLILISSS